MYPVKELVEQSGMSLVKFAAYFGIPYRTLQNWVGGQESCRDYLVELMRYKLVAEGIIKDTLKEKGE